MGRLSSAIDECMGRRPYPHAGPSRCARRYESNQKRPQDSAAHKAANDSAITILMDNHRLPVTNL